MSLEHKLKQLLVHQQCREDYSVPEIVVVINYNCPNHLEEYHVRVGRTGPGTAYTFISSIEEQYSPIMVRALEKAEQPIPEELTAMTNQFKEKVARGEAQWCHSGFGGEGLSFYDVCNLHNKLKFRGTMY